MPAFLCGPGDGGVAGGEAEIHQRVIGGVKLHLVEPMTVTVEADKFRRVLMREPGVFGHLRRAKRCTVGGQLFDVRTAAPLLQGFFQGRVAFEKIHIFKRRRLVRDLMGLKLGLGAVMGHEVILAGVSAIENGHLQTGIHGFLDRGLEPGASWGWRQAETRGGKWLTRCCVIS